jgi:uncharacterized membrane protein (DUF2068 family)
LGRTAGRNPLGLKLIGGFKFVCGLLLVALGVGLFRHAHDDPAAEAEHLVSALKLDPDNFYIHTAIEKVTNIKPKQLRAIGAGTFLYALMYLVEGGGLLLRKHWAEYLTVVATGLFIPLEIYEVVRRITVGRVGLLAINVAIVAYLIYELMQKEREGTNVEAEFAKTPPSPPDPFT